MRFKKCEGRNHTERSTMTRNEEGKAKIWLGSTPGALTHLYELHTAWAPQRKKEKTQEHQGPLTLAHKKCS